MLEHPILVERPFGDRQGNPAHPADRETRQGSSEDAV